MNTKTISESFKPSTYSSNISTPLLERIKELENEIYLLKEQIKILNFELSQEQGRLHTPVNNKKTIKPTVLEQDQIRLIQAALT